MACVPQWTEIFIQALGRMGSNMAEGSMFGPMAVFTLETTWMAVDRGKGKNSTASVAFFVMP
jgi:hypothetical protein